MARRAVAAALLSSLTVVVLAQTTPTLRVVRDDSTMVITNEARADQGARNILNLPCEEGLRVSVFYGPPNEVRMLIDDETVLRSSLAIIRRAEGAGEEEERETIELLDGTATFAGRPACLESFEEETPARVLLEQGRTTIVGSRFFLDEGADVATMDGPIELVREPEGDAQELTASASSLRYDLETDRSNLSGGVMVQAGDRVTEGDSLELDEQAGLATVVGSPAVSREGEDEIRGSVLLYYLDSNDVVIVGGVEGTLEIELE